MFVNTFWLRLNFPFLLKMARCVAWFYCSDVQDLFSKNISNLNKNEMKVEMDILILKPIFSNLK